MPDSHSSPRERRDGLVSLDALAANPATAAALSGEVRQALVLRCLTVLAALATRPPSGGGPQETFNF
jgi:hypothetical protein